ncbi:PIN domain-containing protein [Desulfobotulus sp.]|jgi:predicted nucleic acid-binding protein|uniref:PIN domain-containing protein n=1 Tax=Desulfobotulus sp. TaxID=1940337 RepID=UPI002A35A24F|nr:PIN domain-containing protein [Desulfobotulus sp.]MDY0163088.1 PIN domain-containing protein [Desulfobotulus sp.]
MAIHYTVRAKVVDICADTPKAADAFLVDSNVWYWMTYPNATSHVPAQISDYPRYLNNALEVSARVFHSGLTLAELSHIIEKTEREIYERNIRNSIRPKEFRHNLAGQRGRVVSEIQAAWAQVTSLAEPLALTIDGAVSDSALKRLQSEYVDGYDLFMLESMGHHGVAQIITDDGDFATVPGIQVFTANRNVIQAAKSQGKLVLRT